jgi:hypothetical protein
MEEICVFGPGSLQGEPARLDREKRRLLYRAYEIYPRFADGQSDPKHSSQEPHPLAGMRHFNRVAFELRKGVAKTEFASWICYEELHPAAPVRFDHWGDEQLCDLCEPGKPCGRAVVAPFIPMMATAEEQVQELAYGVLKWVIEHSKDAWMFDIGLERIIRYGDDGTNDGMAMAVSSAPNNRDGARTTFEHFDEPHRLFLPLQKQAHETMIANLPKRPLEDPWALYTSTAGNPGQGSVEEDVRSEAEKMDKDPQRDAAATLFFFARWASDGHDLTTVDGRVKAISEATGPVGEWGKGQFLRTAKDYDREGVDRAYWERVWLNRWRRSGSAMFNPKRYKVIRGVEIPNGSFVASGFDGSRRKDSTAMVITNIDNGMQQLVGLWECPEQMVGPDGQPLEWEVPVSEVGQTLSEVRRKWEHWKMFGDPPYYTEEMASWATLFPDEIVEFWTNQNRRMAYSIRAYLEALESGACQIVGTDYQIDSLLRHLGSAGKRELNITDDQGKPLYVMQHMDGRLADKYDAAMAACLSWTACLEARRKGARPKPKVGMPRRIR